MQIHNVNCVCSERLKHSYVYCVNRSEVNSHFNAVRLRFIWTRSRTLDAPSTLMNLKIRSSSFRPETECRTESRSHTLLSYFEELKKKKTLLITSFHNQTHTNTLSLVSKDLPTTQSSLSAGCRPERISSSQHLHSQSIRHVMVTQGSTLCTGGLKGWYHTLIYIIQMVTADG